jgi:hypothetical protein
MKLRLIDRKQTAVADEPPTKPVASVGHSTTKHR